MHRAGIKRMLRFADAEKPRRLFKCFFAEPRNFFQFRARLEWPVFIAVSHDVLGQHRPQAGRRGARRQTAQTSAINKPDDNWASADPFYWGAFSLVSMGLKTQ